MAVDFITYAEQHLDGIVALTHAEGWPSLAADRARAHRVLTNPGVVCVVALDAGEVVGFVHALTDGEIQGYVASMAVRSSHRRQGIGRGLLDEVFRRAGAERIDLLSDADDFYAALPHRQWTGFRIYPPE